MSYQVLREDAQGPPAYAAGQPKETTRNPPAPSGYMYVPLANSQQAQTATVVACQPRTLPQVSVVEPRPKTKPAILIFSLVLTIICGIHLFLPAFVCLTPGLIFAIVGYSLSDSPQQRSTAKAFHGVSLCCNIASIVFYVLCVIATVVTVSILYAVYWRYDYDYYNGYGGGCWQDCSSGRYNNYDYGSGYYEDYAAESSCSTICY